MKTLIEFISDLMKRGFYGSLLLKFHAGKVVHVEKVESLDVSQFQPK